MNNLYDTEKVSKRTQADWNLKIDCMLKNNGPSDYCLSLVDETYEDLPAKIPDWIKNVFLWYGQDQVSEDELLNAIKYLISEKILIVN